MAAREVLGFGGLGGLGGTGGREATAVSALVAGAAREARPETVWGVGWQTPVPYRSPASQSISEATRPMAARVGRGLRAASARRCRRAWVPRAAMAATALAALAAPAASAHSVRRRHLRCKTATITIDPRQGAKRAPGKQEPPTPSPAIRANLGSPGRSAPAAAPPLVGCCPERWGRQAFPGNAGTGGATGRHGRWIGTHSRQQRKDRKHKHLRQQRLNRRKRRRRTILSDNRESPGVRDTSSMPHAGRCKIRVLFVRTL